MNADRPISFPGNCPANVSRDAKYAVRTRDSRDVASLTFRLNDREVVYLATLEHPELVAMVNRVKDVVAGTPRGSFYINEYRQVIVPAVGARGCYYAGQYDKDLEFSSGDQRIGPRPISTAGDALKPGDRWDGPHAGIPYVLCAGGKDIKYDLEPEPYVKRTILLSDSVGKRLTEQMAARVRECRDARGARFYVNECRAMFTRVDDNDGEGFEHIYVGQLSADDPWFPKPLINA